MLHEDVEMASILKGYIFNWTNFCGEKEFIVWDESQHNFGLCFQKLIFKAIFFSILAIISAYYAGKRTKWYVRTTSQRRIIIFRLICCIFSLLISVLDPLLSYLYVDVPLFWVDILSSSTEIFGWLLHSWYTFSLRERFTRGTRGPRPAILAWVLTLLFYIANARTFWYAKEPIFSLLFMKTFEGIATAHLILQAIYLCTLFPEGLGGSSGYRDPDEQSPLLDPSYSQYRRFQEVIDPYDLGVAEDRVNRLSYLTFYWVNIMMKKGSQGRLVSVDDIYELPSHLKSSAAFQNVHKEMMINQITESSDQSEEVSVRSSRTKYPLLWALHKCYGLQFYALLALKIFRDALTFGGPLLLHVVVSFVDGKVADAWRGYAAAAGLCLTALLSTLCNVHYNYLITKLNIQIRGSLISAVFWKVQHVSTGSLSEFSSGQIVNLMSTDTDRILQFGVSFHAFWSLPIQLILTLFLLYKQMGAASLAGVVLSALMIPINKLIASKIGVLSKMMMHFKDRRVHLMTEVLGMIKSVKLNSFEGIFKGRILDERYGEMKGLAGRKYLDAACVYLWATTPVLMPIITICIFVILGHELDAANIFTAVALFNMLIIPLNSFPWVINSLVEAWISIKRLENLMQVEESNINDYFTPISEMPQAESGSHIIVGRGQFAWSLKEQSRGSNLGHEEVHLDHSTSMQAIVVENDQNISVDSDEIIADRFLLNAHYLHITKGQIVAIVGSVGSGKTALLHSILGEMEKLSGTISLKAVHQGYGYASQNVWIQNSTIKENIVFGQNFDPLRYRTVVHACALEEDFSILPKKDETPCGENGASLSGGQKARVALARAVYQNKNIYLLDDVLSSVDLPVAQHIMRHCIHSFLAGKTVLLVSHNLHLLTRVDWIINMKDGRIAIQGTPKEILPSLTDENIFFNDWYDRSEQLTVSTGAVKKVTTSPPLHEASPIDLDYSMKLDVNSDEILDEDENGEERRCFGELTFSVLLSYFSAVGGWLSALILVSLILMQVTRNLADIWLAKWVSAPAPPVNMSEFSRYSMNAEPKMWIPEPLLQSNMIGSYWRFTTYMGAFNYSSIQTIQPLISMDPITKFYMTIYITLAITNSIFSLMRSFLFAYGGICAAKHLHRKLLDIVLFAKMKFFDVNPLGRILNRFSSDVYSIDDTLPFEMNILLKNIFGLIGSVVVTIYGLPWILLLYIPLMFIYYSIQQFYRYTSRDLRRIYSLSLSPLYNHFTETLNGLSIIRASRSSHRFIVLLDSYLEQNQKAKFCIELVSQWLNLRLQLIGVCILGGVASLCLFQHHTATVSAGVVGLVISYALTINGFLNDLVIYLTKTEQEFISMERVHQYLTSVPKERGTESEFKSPPPSLEPGWPTQGVVSFQSVYLKYHDHNPYSLCDVSFVIRAHEKVGIIGRTGAGKSSLFMALFRIVNLSKGRITIDGVDTADIPLKKLRSSLSIATQDTFLFSGTIKENLDAFGENSLDDIWRVLHECHIAHVVENLGGLHAPMKKGGEDLSAGQRQLFCLARALLSKAKIVCIDEGTSLLDNEMDFHVQSVIKESFRDRTLLIIAHRIHTVKDCDKLILMSEGEVTEIGKPSQIINDKNSAFHSMFRS